MGTEDQTANTAQSLPAVALTLVAGRGMYRANFDNSGEHPNKVISPGIWGGGAWGEKGRLPQLAQGRVYGRETSMFKVISVRPENEVEATWPGLARQKAASP